MSFLNDISRVLYRMARTSRDINAVSRGPRAVGKRLIRKGAGRKVGGFLNRWLS
jgi:hypothetical protein